MFKNVCHFLPGTLQKGQGRKPAFYTIVGIGLLFILFSNPFLKVPFDMWQHLFGIASLHDEGRLFFENPEITLEWSRGLYLWYFIYANIFKFIGINNIFAWAKIIHVFQFMFAFLCLFYFSFTVFKILLPGTKKIHLRYFSLISVFTWFIGNGTLSAGYQQAWIVWYSVTPQGLSNPLLWYIAALTVKIFYEKLSLGKLSLFSVQILCVSFIILKVHPQEFIFYCIHLIILSLLNLKKIFHFMRRHYFLFFSFLLSFLVIVSFIALVKRRKLDFFQLFTKNIKEILKKISESGSSIINAKLHRFPANFSEIVLVSLILALCFLAFYFIFKKKKQGKIIYFNLSIYTYLVIVSLLFFLIPMNRFLIGTWAFFSRGTTHVPRFFFGSAFFIFIPFLVYMTLTFFKKGTPSPPYKENIGLSRIVLFKLSFICLLVLASKFLFYNVLYQNTRSIFNMLDRSKVGIQYTDHDLEWLKEIILQYDKKAGTQSEKPNIYYIRADLGPIVRGVSRKYVFQRRRHSTPMFYFFYRDLDKRYNLIEVDLPPDFPKDKEIFKYFNLEKMSISKSKKLQLPKEGDEIKYNIDRITKGKKFIRIKGWGYIQGQSSENAKIYVVLKSPAKTYIFDSYTQKRPDVTRYFKTLNFDDSGFAADIFKKDIPGGIHNIGIYIEKGNTCSLTYSDRVIKKENERFKILKIENIFVSKLQKITLPQETNNIKYNIDRLQEKKGTLIIMGWGYIQGQSSENAEIYVVLKSLKSLKSNKKSYIFDTLKQTRPDVTASFKTLNFDESGYHARIKKKRLQKGEYKIGIYIKKKDSYGLTYTDKVIRMK